MNPHILVALEFAGFVDPTCPPGKVPLSTKDPMAQDLLAIYAQRRREVDAEFSDGVEIALGSKGFDVEKFTAREAARQKILSIVIEAVQHAESKGLPVAEDTKQLVRAALRT
jgi:hypothetical protein